MGGVKLHMCVSFGNVALATQQHFTEYKFYKINSWNEILYHIYQPNFFTKTFWYVINETKQD
jgi:hypothetical protein